MQINWEQLEGVKPKSLSIVEQSGGKIKLEPTRTDETEQAYFDFVKSTLKNIGKYNGLETTEGITCEDIKRWIESVRVTYRANSWRFARASFCNLLQRALTFYTQALENNTDLIQAGKLRDNLAVIEEALFEIKTLKWSAALTNVGKSAAQRSNELPAKSSSAKVKFVDAELLYRIDQYIKLTGSEWQRRALKLCWATMYTGLRPCEWEHARIEEDGKKINLIVVNAKNTNGRAGSDTRELLVSDAIAVQTVRLQIESITQWKEYAKTSKAGSDFSKVYVTLCANALRIAQVQYFGESKGITPYSFRHQFAANLKSAGFSKVDVAKSMGHASVATLNQNPRIMGHNTKIAARREAAKTAVMPEDFAIKTMTPVITVISDATTRPAQTEASINR